LAKICHNFPARDSARGFLGAESLRLPARVAEGYDGIREMTGAHLAMPGTRLGDPAKAATAIIGIAQTGRQLAATTDIPVNA
jgi:hypothetical protein